MQRGRGVFSACSFCVLLLVSWKYCWSIYGRWVLQESSKEDNHTALGMGLRLCGEYWKGFLELQSWKGPFKPLSAILCLPWEFKLQHSNNNLSPEVLFGRYANIPFSWLICHCDPGEIEKIQHALFIATFIRIFRKKHYYPPFTKYTWESGWFYTHFMLADSKFEATYIVTKFIVAADEATIKTNYNLTIFSLSLLENGTLQIWLIDDRWMIDDRR